MTPQERQMVDELFGRLATMENSPRDPEAERAVLDGLRRAPNAAYALVQTVLVQDEALKRANQRIEELEGGAPEQQPSGGFLDSMRGALLGEGNARGSVPSVRPGGGDRPVWNSGQVMGGAPQAGGGYADPRGGAGGGFGGGGSSFLGTAAAAATGVIGGSLLMNGIRNLMGGGGHQQSFGDSASLGGDKSSGPWGGGNDSSGGNLSRDAGINDIGKNPQDSDRQNFADNSANQRDDNNDRDDSYDRDNYASNDGYGNDDDSGDDDFDDGGSDYA